MTGAQRHQAIIAARRTVAILVDAAATADGPAQDALVAKACASAESVVAILAPKPPKPAKEPT
mgnify:CR=1 FL=1